MYPQNDPRLDFDCDCPILQRKNVWNDITGVVVRYCPMCNTSATVDYIPTEKWEDTGRGKAGEAMPAQLVARMKAADARRKAR